MTFRTFSTFRTLVRKPASQLIIYAHNDPITDFAICLLLNINSLFSQLVKYAHNDPITDFGILVILGIHQTMAFSDTRPSGVCCRLRLLLLNILRHLTVAVILALRNTK